MRTVLETVKRLIPLRAKRALISTFLKEEIKLPSGSRAFVFLAADYGNIGDLAITAAQIAFLKKESNFLHIIRIPISKTRNYIHSIKRQVGKHDLITIVGGGNMGSLYPDIEELRQLVIGSFPNNRIVCFPQTLDWNGSAGSTRALRRITKVYSQHPNLHIFARESITKEKLETLFGAHKNVTVGYAPDIVLSVNKKTLGIEDCSGSVGIMLCMRNDIERMLTSEHRAELDEILKSSGYSIELTDTHVGGSNLDEDSCSRLLANKLNQFAAAKLVVTDRLHGMILSIVAGTPCLVLPNSNHKIQQTYKNWLINIPQVKLISVNHMTVMPELLAELLSMSKYNLDSLSRSDWNYESLKRAITQS